MTIEAITPLKKRATIYSDFRKDLAQSPISEDITILKDEDAVKDSIRNLLLTDRRERLLQPFLGAGLREMLFENITPATLKLIEDRVKTTIRAYEPRAELIDVEVASGIDDNTVSIIVKFYVINLEQPITLDVILERIR